jgi:hypothetical protein
VGRSWVQVLTDEGPGWIEKKEVSIQDLGSSGFWVRFKLPIILLILIIAGILVYRYYSNQAKKKVKVS